MQTIKSAGRRRLTGAPGSGWDSWTRFAGRRGLVSFAAVLGVCQGAGLLGVPFTAPTTGAWFDRLEKPSYNPSDAVFGPVWATLYTMMALSAWLVSRRGLPAEQHRALSLLAGQLALNAAWTPIFFGARRPGWALADLAALLAVLLLTVRAVWQVRPVAALLLLPYLGWTIFAGVLNTAIVVKNR